MAEEEKKSIFDKLIDAVTDRDEKAAAEKAAAEKLAAEKLAAEKLAAEKAAAEKLAAEKAAAEKAAMDKFAADKAAAERAADQRAAAEKVAAMKAASEKAAAERAERETAQVAAAPKKGVVQVRSLRIRSDHTTDSSLVGGLVRGDAVTVLETWTDGKDTWARIGPDQWAALIYEGETFIALE